MLDGRRPRNHRRQHTRWLLTVTTQVVVSVANRQDASGIHPSALAEGQDPVPFADAWRTQTERGSAIRHVAADGPGREVAHCLECSNLFVKRTASGRLGGIPKGRGCDTRRPAALSTRIMRLRVPQSSAVSSTGKTSSMTNSRVRSTHRKPPKQMFLFSDR